MVVVVIEKVSMRSTNNRCSSGLGATGSWQSGTLGHRARWVIISLGQLEHSTRLCCTESVKAPMWLASVWSPPEGSWVEQSIGQLEQREQKQLG